MPRQAHGRSLLEGGPSRTRKKPLAKGRGLNALETAEKQYPDKIRIGQHRLGEADEDDNEAPNTRAGVDERSAKRRKIDTSMGQTGSEDEGSDPDGNPWHVGVEEDDEDSDIDSDEAFGESDEERFADFTFRGSEKPKRSQRRTPIQPGSHQGDDNSDAPDVEGDDDDSLGDDAIDLATAWDLDDEEQRKEQEKQIPKRRSREVQQSAVSYNSSEMSTESATDEESEEEELSFEDFSGDENSEETTARLRSFVDSLTRAPPSTEKSRHQTRTSTFPDKPSQLALPAGNLSAADLMQYVKDPTQRRSLKLLQAAAREDGTSYKGGIPGKLAVPLAKRQQDRLDRVAAYDQTKQTVDRWVDTVKQNRRAEHVSFPQIDRAKASASSVRNFQPVSQAQPQSELESKIQEIMQESGLVSARPDEEEAREQQYEELQEKKMPLEELQARRRELRMQRELMFREEVRAKRIKKIKSKAYRRVHRKEKDKFAVQERERLAAAGILNSDEEREQNDRRRAEERMGARHRESKWAKAAKATGQTVWNDDAKVGVTELARRDEELRRRIEGRNIRGSDVSSSESEAEDSDSDEGAEKWNRKISALEHAPETKGQSTLASMAFMQRAEAERKAQNDEELRMLRRSMAGDVEVASARGSDEESSGRQKFGTKNIKPINPVVSRVERNEFEERLSDDEAREDGKDLSSPPETVPVAALRISQPSKNLRTGGSKQLVEKQKAPKPELKVRSRAGKHQTKINSTQTALDDYTSPSEPDSDQFDGLDDKDKLALDVFAGDDQEDLRKQFQKEKKQTEEEEGDQVIDNTLPGWGSWTGAGISRQERKKAKGRFLVTVKGVAPEARKDARLERVIMNEKRVKKNGKYLATELPYPFESRQQYERSLRLPMGPEWSTRNHFQDSIKPRVLLKQGQVIRPMAKPTA